MKRLAFLLIISTLVTLASAQPVKKGKYGDGPDDVPVVGVIKGLTDQQLLETVQKQSF